MTSTQAALDGAMAKLQRLWPKTVRLSLAPTKDVAANVGEFRKVRAQEDSGFTWIESGKVCIRRAVLLAAGITGDLADNQTLTVNGTEYRITFVTPDSTGFVLDCLNLS